MEQFIFLRPPGPGAFARLAERRAPDTPEWITVELGDSRTAPPWRVVYARDPRIEAWLPVWQTAFGPEIHRLVVAANTWVWDTVSPQGRTILGQGSLNPRPWWSRLPGSPVPLPDWWDAAPEPGLPLGAALHSPDRVVEFEAVDSLDQRGLLVETVPVRYRIRIPSTPAV